MSASHRCLPHPFSLDRIFTSSQKSLLGWQIMGMGDCQDGNPSFEANQARLGQAIISRIGNHCGGES